MFFQAQKIKTFALLLLFLIPHINNAQTPQFPEYSYQLDANYLKSYWTTSKKIVTFPARWRAGEWVAFTGVVAGSVALYLYDDEIRSWIQRNPSVALDNLSEYGFKGWGNGLYPAALFGGFYIYGLATQDLRARQIALGGLQAFIMTGVTTQIVKQLTHRHRPYQENPPDPEAWDGPFSNWEYTSFPSGHTSTAFALAALISSVYKDHVWVGIVSYTLATGVAWSRIYDNKHWPSDVFFGAALGFAIGKTVYHVMQGNTNLSLGISDNGGVSLVYHLK
jgi:membrane-associated phospholipid phosphatase